MLNKGATIYLTKAGILSFRMAYGDPKGPEGQWEVVGECSNKGLSYQED